MPAKKESKQSKKIKTEQQSRKRVAQKETEHTEREYYHLLVKLLEDTKREIGERLNLLGRSVCEAEERERDGSTCVCGR